MCDVLLLSAALLASMASKGTLDCLGFRRTVHRDDGSCLVLPAPKKRSLFECDVCGLFCDNPGALKQHRIWKGHAERPKKFLKSMPKPDEIKCDHCARTMTEDEYYAKEMVCDCGHMVLRAEAGAVAAEHGAAAHAAEPAPAAMPAAAAAPEKSMSEKMEYLRKVMKKDGAALAPQFKEKIDSGEAIVVKGVEFGVHLLHKVLTEYEAALGKKSKRRGANKRQRRSNEEAVFFVEEMKRLREEEGKTYGQALDELKISKSMFSRYKNDIEKITNAKPDSKSKEYNVQPTDPRNKHRVVLNEVRKRVGNLRNMKRKVNRDRMQNIAKAVATAAGVKGGAYHDHWCTKFIHRFDLRPRKPTYRGKLTKNKERENLTKLHNNYRKMLSPPGPGEVRWNYNRINSHKGTRFQGCIERR